MAYSTIGYGIMSSQSDLIPFKFERRELRPNDVKIDIKYCGVCHSDLHQARNDWHSSVYPLVPGHEIVGFVSEVGSEVGRHKVGDRVAVGCMVDSCLSCVPCQQHEEQFCEKGLTGTYNGKDKITGEVTFGGYSKSIVVRQEFVLNIPLKMDLEKVAPILCAGITTYSPLKAWGVKSGDKIAVVGLGGLGHMAVKLGAALGAEVTVFTTSEKKQEEAKRLGATHVVLSNVDSQMSSCVNQFSLIIDTIPIPHDLAPYIKTLSIDGTLVIVGAIDMIPTFHSGLLLWGRKRVAASVIGGIAETQEVLNFCAEKGIYPECEIIKMDSINNALEKMKKGQVKYRFVIDMDTLKEED